MNASTAHSQSIAHPGSDGTYRCPRLCNGDNGLSSVGKPPPPERCKIVSVLCPELEAVSTPVIPSPLLTERKRPDDRSSR